MPKKSPKDSGVSDNTPDVEKLESLGEQHAEQTQAEVSQDGQSQAASETGTSATPTGKRGRHKKDCTCERCVNRRLNPSASRSTGEVVPVIPLPLARMIIGMPYKIMASRRGPHWEISEEEIDLMVPAHMELANQYLPDLLKQHAALVTVISLHAMHLYVRVTIDRRVQKEDEENTVRYEPREGVPGKARFGQVYETEEGPNPV